MTDDLIEIVKDNGGYFSYNLFRMISQQFLCSTVEARDDTLLIHRHDGKFGGAYNGLLQPVGIREGVQKLIILRDCCFGRCSLHSKKVQSKIKTTFAYLPFNYAMKLSCP